VVELPVKHFIIFQDFQAGLQEYLRAPVHLVDAAQGPDPRHGLVTAEHPGVGFPCKLLLPEDVEQLSGCHTYIPRCIEGRPLHILQVRP
jgi:hypothetical protein